MGGRAGPLLRLLGRLVGGSLLEVVLVCGGRHCERVVGILLGRWGRRTSPIVEFSPYCCAWCRGHG